MRKPGVPQANPTPQPSPCWRPDCRFVPVRPDDLADLLVREASQDGEDATDLPDVFQRMRDVLEQESVSFERELDALYAPFNPDRDTVPLGETPDDTAELRRRLSYLLDKANYERLDDIQIAEVVRRANEGNIRVRIHADRVEFLDLWVRGHGHTCTRQRTFRRPVRGVEIRRPVFKRLAVVARLKNEQGVLIKLFKDIPEAEVEALLPHAEAAMTLLDRIKLFGSGAGVLGATVMKLAKVAMALAMLSKIMWILLVGVGTIALRTFFGYRNAKTSRDWRRTQRLYFQNLGNNASALQLLVASVKQEELKEAMLAYTFCLKQDDEQPLSKNGLCRRIERFLGDHLGVEVDFDIEDAIETVTRLSLWHQTAPRSVVCCQQAIKLLEKHAAEQRSADYHQQVEAS